MKVKRKMIAAPFDFISGMLGDENTKDPKDKKNKKDKKRKKSNDRKFDSYEYEYEYQDKEHYEYEYYDDIQIRIL